MSSSAFRLRPLSLADLLDETVRLYRRHFLLFVAIGAVVKIPLAFLGLLLGAYAVTAPGGGAAAAERLPGVFSFGLFLGILSFLTTELMNGAMIAAISQSALGQRATLGSSFGRVGPRIWSLAAMAIVYGVAMVLMFITCIGIVAVVYFGLAWSFSAQALVLEGRGVFSSLSRSHELLRGSWWRAAGYGLVLAILTFFASLVASVPALILGGISEVLGGRLALSFVSQILSTLAEAVATPVGLAGWTLFYYDLRVRKEGFDLEMLAQALESTSGPQAGAS